MKKIIFLILLVSMVSSVLAVAPSVNLSDCYDYSTIAIDDGSVDDLIIFGVCNNTASIEWTSILNLTTLGEISSGVIIDKNAIFVNSLTRPDLDERAHLSFTNTNYMIEPDVLKDGVNCSDCDNITYDKDTRTIEFDVSGFSNYSLTHSQDMDVYTDDEAYLKDAVYQTIDFGATNDTYKCVVMIFDKESGNLLQSNPRRQKREKDVLSISTDLNLEDNSPEYLGYFKSENGLANVYYEKNLLIGYASYIYVAKCHSNAGVVKNYEEIITPQYWELFKDAPARWVWWSESASVAVWVIISFLIFVLIIWYGIKHNFG